VKCIHCTIVIAVRTALQCRFCIFFERQIDSALPLSMKTYVTILDMELYFVGFVTLFLLIINTWVTGSAVSSISCLLKIQQSTSEDEARRHIEVPKSTAF